MKLKHVDTYEFMGFRVDIFVNKNGEFFHELSEGGEHEGPFSSEEKAMEDANERIYLAQT